MNLILTQSLAPQGDAAPVEVVERKGLGHPDTICDALAEEFSVALSRFYLDHFGAVLHHNVDKALLVAGASEPAFGGGRVVAPFDVFLAGRAVREFRGVEVPLADLAIETSRAWLDRTFRCLDLETDVVLHCLARPGSVDLRELFERTQHAGQPLSNDTSCGVGHAPFSTLECVVLAAEHRLNSKVVKDRLPSVGEDVKVMGVRSGTDISLTISCAQVDRYLAGLDEYRASIAALEQVVRDAAAMVTEWPVEVAANVGDDLDRGEVFLTVTGTSAEAGDDGAAGRGNRIGGLITPHRAMTMESAAGKNPITHVGKLYNVLANRVATALVDEVPEAASVECYLVSQIGRPISEPKIVQLSVSTHDGASAEAQRPAIEGIEHYHLEHAGELWQQFLDRAIVVF